MATRFYLPGPGATTPPVSPAFDAGWEQTGQAVRRLMVPKLFLRARDALTDSGNITVPITTTQDILGFQYVSDPLRAQTVSGTCSFVVRAFESATTANVTLAVVARAFSLDGATLIGTLFSTFNTGTEFAVSASAATRIVSASAVTLTTCPEGWRLVVDIGGHAAGPTAATSYTMRFGTSATSDFALTAALTTDLNPWFELSQDVFAAMPNNYQSVRSGDGISVAEKIR